MKVAKHCCERFYREVLRHLHVEEEELRRELVSGDLDVPRSWRTDNEVHRKRAEARLEELRPVFALVREWCGQDAMEEFREVIALRQEVDRLQGVVKDLAEWKGCGPSSEGRPGAKSNWAGRTISEDAPQAVPE